MSDDANDVSKALAAFGAPAIRYHSFGQAQVKPSSVVLPRRVVLPGEAVPPTLTRQQEPDAAPELIPLTTAAHEPLPPPVVEHRHAPTLRQAEPMRAPPPIAAASAPTVAPPPRPLAEWAAPVVAPAPRPVMAPSPRPAPSIPAPVPETFLHEGRASYSPATHVSASSQLPVSYPSTPAVQSHLAAEPHGAHASHTTAPVHTPAPHPHSPPGRPMPPAAVVPAAAPMHDAARPASVGAGRTLQEIFEFLATGSGSRKCGIFVQLVC